MKMGDVSIVQRPSMTSRGVRRNGLNRAARETLCQNNSSLASGLSASLGIAVDENGGVHCPGRGAGYAFDAEPRLIEKAVEHAPGKGSVRATALQRKVDQNLAPAALRIRVHPRRP